MTDLELAVTELATNSIDHSGGTGTLHNLVRPRPTDQRDHRRRTTDHPLTGRGLLLVNHIIDLVRVRTTTTGTTIQIHLRLPTTTPPTMQRSDATAPAPRHAPFTQ